MVPELVGKLTALGYEVAVEPGAGIGRAVLRRGVRRGRCRRRRRRLLRRRRHRRGQPARQRDRPSAARGHGDGLLPPGQQRPRPRRRPARLRHHVVRDGAGAAHQPRPVDGRAVLAGAGVRLPLRDRRGRDAAPLLPPQHDRGGHRAAGRGRRPRRRGRRPPGHRDRPAPRRRRQGVRRARRRRGGDPLARRPGDRPRARDPRGLRRLRPRDDRGPGGPAAGAADAVHRRGGRPHHDRGRARTAPPRCS